MKQGVSEIIGQADGPGVTGVTVYRALKPLLCAPCGEPIGAGTLFTRLRLPGRGPCIPRCRKCAPFELREAGGEGRRSPLLESLLTARPEEQAGEAGRPDAVSPMEAVERRLGPALRRCRRRAGS
jgi:hypothetical protein